MYICTNLSQNLCDGVMKYFGHFLILGTMSTMVSRRIFDKRAKYVGRFVKTSGYSAFSRWKMYVCTQFISKSLRLRVKYFEEFLILGTMSIMVYKAEF